MRSYAMFNKPFPLENWSISTLQHFPVHRGFEMAALSFAQADPPMTQFLDPEAETVYSRMFLGEGNLACYRGSRYIVRTMTFC